MVSKTLVRITGILLVAIGLLLFNVLIWNGMMVIGNLNIDGVNIDSYPYRIYGVIAILAGALAFASTFRKKATKIEN